MKPNLSWLMLSYTEVLQACGRRGLHDEFLDSAKILQVIMAGAYDDPQNPSKLRGKGFGWWMSLDHRGLHLVIRNTPKALGSAQRCFALAGFTPLFEAYSQSPKVQGLLKELAALNAGQATVAPQE